MLRSGVRGLLGVLAFIDPPSVPKAVFLPAISYELPDPSRAGARKGQRLERAFRLRQVDQILRQALFPQHARNHLAITPGAAPSGFHDGAAARSLEKIEEGKYLIIHGQPQL